jgi:DNA end-binding protein Ku
MPRPIWTGTLSFGLLNIPVSLMAGERRTDISFRMLDSRDNSPVRYERVNAESGEEVPWKEIVKAFEYSKGNYVVLEEEDFKRAAPEGREAVEMQAFVDEDAIDPRYYEKPYVLVPGKKAEKGYVLLRETLKDLKRVGIGRVVIRTREYLCLVKPQDDALVLLLLRFPQELVDLEDYALPEGAASDYRITKPELDMAKKLVDSLSAEWDPSGYKDEFRTRLKKVIDERLKDKGATTRIDDEGEEADEDAATNVVDFMSLLQQSLASGKRTGAAAKAPAKKVVKAAKKVAPAKAPAKKAAPKKAAKKAAKKAPARKAG